jgi:hypothetical protein
MIAYSSLQVNDQLTLVRERMNMQKKLIIDDGFRPELVETAIFSGKLEIPTIRKPDKIIIPNGLIPFSVRTRSHKRDEFVVFYEHDIRFRDVLIAPENYIEDFRSFTGVVSPDCSLYRDMPLCLQIANTYMNRAIGHYLQNRGIYVIPNIRWGDERTYTTCELPEKFAFLGVEKHSIVSIGTYGCIRGKENRFHFRAGLEAMLEELDPTVVLVYGAMPKDVFSDLTKKTKFIHYPDWMSMQRKKAC